MSDSQCYLCGKLGKIEKLFRGCKHESACYSCLRNCYVIQAQTVTQYPLQCFHPECNLVLRNTQIERFVQSKQELQNYHSLSAKAKMHKVQLGDNWQEILEVLGEALGSIEICRCPGCRMLVTKNGGCDHMSCICGTEFNWYFWRRSIKESCQQIQQNFSRMTRRHSLENSALYDQTKSIHRINIDFILENCTDYLSVINESADIFAEDDTADVLNDPNEAVETTGEDITQSVNPTMTSDLDFVLPNIDNFPPLKGQCLTVAETQTTWEQDFHVLELASDASDDSWTQFDAENEISLTTDNDVQTTGSQTTWQEVSEVSSVVSFHSKTGMSFLETARAASNQPDRKNRWKEVSKVPLPMIKMQTISEHRKPTLSEPEPDADQMCDADFMFDGAKCSRGGKQKYMFKHQPKRKCRRWRRLDNTRKREPVYWLL